MTWNQHHLIIQCQNSPACRLTDCIAGDRRESRSRDKAQSEDEKRSEHG